MKSNEKACVCNTFAALILENPGNMGTFSYASDNKSSPRDNQTRLQICLQNLRNLVFLGIFFIYIHVYGNMISVRQTGIGRIVRNT